MGKGIDRQVLVLEGKDKTVLYGLGGIRRGDLIFTLSLDCHGNATAASALAQDVVTNADNIVASFELPTTSLDARISSE